MGCSWNGVGGGKGYCSIPHGAHNTPLPPHKEKDWDRTLSGAEGETLPQSLFESSSFGTFQFNFYFFPLQRWAGKGVYLGTKPRKLRKGVYFKGAKEGPAKGREVGSPLPPPSQTTVSAHSLWTSY